VPTDVLREEFEELKREVEGEKMVTRYILEQTRRNGDDLAALNTKVDGLSHDVAGLRGEFAEFRSEFVGLRGTVSGLVANLPRIIGVVREVLREGDKK
jgi:hypothetical protein